MEKNALWLLCVLVLPVIACGNKEDDLVTGLPGQPPVNFRHYSGYVNLGPRQKQKSLFYWFFEAQQNTARRPLVLWLNGGPGCSAIATGAAQELGPFLVHTKGGNLTFNEFSWNKEANILFLEAPVGVGFSYSNNSTDLQNLGDQVTAEDSLVFLINWFKKFPEFRSNEFYITGESYAGHYVPQLAEVIHDRNKKVTRDSRINLKGIMIGNPVINEATDAAGIVDYAWSHALISDEVHKLIHDSCRFGDKLTAQCNKSFTAFTAYAAINIYSIYTPVCLSSSPSSKNYTRVMSDHNLLTSQNIWGRLPYAYDPCTPHYAEKYFNRKDVQVALHANVTNLPYPYTACSSVIKWTEAPTTVIPIIQKLLKGGLRIWIYRDRLSTMDRVVKWSHGVDTTCVLCNAAQESRDHLFFECQYTAQVWEFIVKGILGSSYTNQWSEIMVLITDSSRERKSLFCLRYSFQAVLYGVWRERNKVRHGDRMMPVPILQRLIEKSIRNKISVLRKKGIKGMEMMMQYWFLNRM